VRHATKLPQSSLSLLLQLMIAKRIYCVLYFTRQRSWTCNAACSIRHRSGRRAFRQRSM